MKEAVESLGSFRALVEDKINVLSQRDACRRLWNKDATLWKEEPSKKKEIQDRLGWLSVVAWSKAQIPALRQVAQDIAQKKFRHAVLLGMGGSSLCVEVMRQSFGVNPGFPDMVVLDSTDPATVLSVEKRIQLDQTLFIVASKSGGTVEVASFLAYFWEKVKADRGDQAGSQFMAITDPGTALEEISQDRKFLYIITNPADIGGRFSALSNFGMATAAIMGLDPAQLLESAEQMVQACGPDRPVANNPGVRLGAIMGGLASTGRDKVTFIVSPGIGTFGLWAEQLIAESTGKEGKGIVPIDGELLGPPADYSQDRLFVYLRLENEPDPAQDAAVNALENSGQPVIRIAMEDRYALGAEFFRFEVATAVAGALLAIDPFDQPNVQESKDNTKKLLGEFREMGKLPQPAPIITEGGISLVASQVTSGLLAQKLPTLATGIEAHLGSVKPGDYLAINAYLEPSAEHHALLQTLRQKLRQRLGVATTLGYGPRFLHSTGQLHKGGANHGVFIQFVAEDSVNLPVPGEPYTFSILKQAQALGDFQSLDMRQRRAISINLGHDIVASLEKLIRLVG